MSDHVSNGISNGEAASIQEKMRPLWEPESSKHNTGERLPTRKFINRVQHKFGLDFSVDTEPYTGIGWSQA